MSVRLYCGGGGDSGDARNLQSWGVDLDCDHGLKEAFAEHVSQDLDDAIEGDLTLAGRRVWVELEYRNLKMWARVWEDGQERPALPRVGLNFGAAHFTSHSFNRDEDWLLNPGKLVLRAENFDASNPVKIRQIGLSDILAGPKLGVARGAHSGGGLTENGRYYPLGKYLADKPHYVFDVADGLLPSVIMEDNQKYVDLYNKAWELAYDRSRQPLDGEPWHRTWLDEAHSSQVFVWDLAAMMWFGKYMNRAFDPMASMDIWYQIQRDDGGIPRRVYEDDAQVTTRDGEVNPPLFAWSEWQSYLMTGDEDRIRRVLPALREYVDYSSIVRWAQDSEHRLYWNDGGGGGLDYLKRPYKRYSDGGAEFGDPDMSAQTAQAYLLLAEMYAVVGDDDESQRMQEIGDAIGERINHFMWKEFEDDGQSYGQWFYVRKDGQYAPDEGQYVDQPQGPGLWYSLVDTTDSHKELLANIMSSPDYYFTDMPFGTLPRSHDQFQGWGGHSQGSVYPPILYMGVKGAERTVDYEFAQTLLKRYLDGMVEVFDYSGTVWEFYAPMRQWAGSVMDHRFHHRVLDYHLQSRRSSCTATIIERFAESDLEDRVCGILKMGHPDLDPGSYVAPARRIEKKSDNDVVYRTPLDRHGNSVVAPDFVGWAGLGPIALMIENIIGIRADVPERKITWHLTRTDRHGIEDLWLGEIGKIDLIAASRPHRRATTRIEVSTSGHQDDYGTLALEVILSGGCSQVLVVNQDQPNQQFDIDACAGSSDPVERFMLYASNADVTGMSHRNDEFWMVDNNNRAVYQYDDSISTVQSTSEDPTVVDYDKINSAKNTNGTGVYYKNDTVDKAWIADYFDTYLYGYDVWSDGSITGNRLGIDLDGYNDGPRGIDGSGHTLWVVDHEDDHVYAYSTAPGDNFGDRLRDKEFSLKDWNDDPWGIWTDGKIAWVNDTKDDNIRAYDLTRRGAPLIADATITLDADNGWPRGMWSDGKTLWVADSHEDAVFSYAIGVDVSFSEGSYSVAEGEAVTVEVLLSAAAQRRVEVPISVRYEGGAGAADVSGVPASVVFEPGVTLASFELSAVVDPADEGESVVLGFGDLPSGVVAGSVAEAEVTIVDLVGVSFSEGSYSVAEGEMVLVGVSLSADPQRRVEVPISVRYEGGAGAADVSGVPASVVFEPGVTLASFELSAVADAADEGESVVLGFGDLPSGVVAGSVAEAEVTIVDPVGVSFSEGSYSVAEGEAVTVEVLLSAAAQRRVEVPISVRYEGGAGAADVSGVPASVVFEPGVTLASFELSAVVDPADEGESVVLGFGDLPVGVEAGSVAEAEVTIGPVVGVSFSEGSYSVAEGVMVLVGVSLSADPQRRVEVPISVRYEGGAGAADVSGVPASVVFEPGVTLAWIFLEAVVDPADAGESVVLGFGDLPSGVVAGSVAEAEVTIAGPVVGVSFSEGSYSVAEGVMVLVGVSLSADPQRRVEVPISVRYEGGAGAADVSGVPASVVFEPGVTLASFELSAVVDAADAGESVVLGFGDLPSGVVAGSVAEAEVTIAGPVVGVSFSEGSYSVAEGEAVTVEVSLSADPQRRVEVPISVRYEGGAGAADVSGVPASVVFEPGVTLASFELSAVADAADEGENVVVGFGEPPEGVSVGEYAEAVVSILGPPVTVSFEQASYSVTEAHSVEVAVLLDAAPGREVTVSVTRYGGAGAADVSGVPASVVFGADETRKTFTVNAQDDDIYHGAAAVVLGFGAPLPERVVAGTVDTVKVHIDDDDVPDVVTVSFEQESYSVTEGPGLVVVAVVLDAAPGRRVEVPLRVEFRGGADSSDLSRLPPESVVFEAGQTRTTFRMGARHEYVDDVDGEAVVLGFAAPLPEGVVAGTVDAAAVDIVDKDGPVVTLSFDQASYVVAEGASIEVTLRLDTAPGREIRFRPTVKVGGGGADETDFDWSVTSSGWRDKAPGSTSSRWLHASDFVYFAADETTKTFTVSAHDDDIDDDDEQTWLRMRPFSHGVTDVFVFASVRIVDNDHPEVTVSFEQASYEVSEGVGVEVAVVLDAAPEREVVVPVSISYSGGATSSDLSGVPASVVFGADETRKTFTVIAQDDDIDDDGEVVVLGFAAPLPERVVAGTVDAAAVHIVDDDVPEVTVGFEQESYTANEGSSVVVTVQLSAAPEREVVVPLSWVGRGGVGEADFSGVPESVTFEPDETEKVFTFDAVDDSIDDDSESLVVSIGAPPERVNHRIPGDSTTIYIVDDD